VKIQIHAEQGRTPHSDMLSMKRNTNKKMMKVKYNEWNSKFRDEMENRKEKGYFTGL